MIRYALLIALVLCTVDAARAEEAEATTQPAVTELRPILSPQARRDRARKLIDRFVAHVQTSSAIDPAARDVVVNAWKQHRDDEQPEDFLTAALAIISEPFKNALTALEREDHAKADEALRPLIESRDPYLSLHAAGLLARSLVEQERPEEAEAVLAPLAAKEEELLDKTFLETEVDFLLGYCQLANLEYDAALATLTEFERQHADAPDHYRLPARQMLQELRARQPERLGDVADLMGYAGRGLAHRQVGQPVQARQKQAVDLLNALIREAEEYEKQQQARKNQAGQGGRPSGNQQPGSPAMQSMLPGGSGRIGDLGRSPLARPGETWGQMRPEERERILQSLRKNFPPRYRQLVEQYYKQLGK